MQDADREQPWRVVNPTTLEVCVKVIPKSSTTKFGGRIAVDHPFKVALKIHLSAVPEGGKANAALVAFLAKTWHVTKATILLLSGETARVKTLRLCELSASKHAEIVAALQDLAEA